MPGTITMTGGVPTWFVDQFSATLYHVCQQRESKFGKGVRVESVLSAEDKAFDMMDALSLEEKTARNVETPSMDPTTQRRWVNTVPYHNSVLFDKDDDLNMIIDPTSDFVMAFRRAVNRTKDDIILAAFEADVSSGRRSGSTITWAAQDGNVKYTGASTGRTIQHDCAVGNCSASDTGMTVEKIELIKEYFANNDCEEDTPIWCAISPRQATQLFGQEEYVRIDYNNQKPLATGRIIENWHGINWIVSSKIVVGSSNDVDGDTNVYECWAWLQDGMILGVQDDVTVRITEESTLSYSQRVYVHMNMGCMRMDEDRVIKVECQ
jgi:hypothetical protein